MPRLLRKSGDTPRKSLWQRVKDVALRDVGVMVRGGVKDGSLESLEQLLLESDFGVPVSLRLVAEVEDRAKRGKVKTEDEFRLALAEGVEAALRAGNSDPAFVLPDVKPAVVLIIGVNGAGKTTFIGKLSAKLRAEGKRVMVAAGDTFRAGAIDQLKVWAQRTGAEFIGGQAGGDPAAVAFDAIDAAVARGMDVLIVDTAGRLHTASGLMDELR
ncbi:MAG TPA: signal recognition particle receptor subunit alpha, partial [Gemmatimonadaceae bacterium]|nr:signal recognition particle receptor subunit alpha [Gemmatimonadaceae bacterium]